MPALPHPHWPIFLSGLGVAGSVLAAIVVTFTLASAVVAFGVWPSDPSSVELSSLTVASAKQLSTTRSRAGAPIVLPRAVSAPAGGASATLAPGVAGAAPSRSRQGRTPGAVAGSGATTTYDSGAPSTSEVSGRPGSDTPGPAPSGEGPLAKVGGTVDETTRSLGGSLRGVTDSLGRHLDPLSPTVGGTVRKAGDALANTVQGLGSAVAALLGHVPHGPNLPPGR